MEYNEALKTAVEKTEDKIYVDISCVKITLEEKEE